MSKSKRNPVASRQRLLNAGVAVFSRWGVDGASVAMIARRARLNRRMLYHYFGSKGGLYRAVIRHMYEQIGSIEVKLAHVLLPAEQLIKRIIRAYYEFLAGHSEFVRLLTWENLRRGRAVRGIDVMTLKSPIVEALHIALRRGREEGRFREDVDEKQLLISCVGLSFFCFSNEHTLREGLGFDIRKRRAMNRRIRHVVRLLLEGIQNKQPAKQKRVIGG